jgi:photosystem II stability/assembly factor-like uncharacterized protein
MSSQKPLTLLSLGVLIITIAQGCSLPGTQLFRQVPKVYGILKLDPSITTGNFKDKFGAVNDVVNNNNESAGSLSTLTISRIQQFQKDNLFAVSTGGGLYNTNNGGQNWRQIATSEGVVTLGLDFAKESDSGKLIIGGSVNTTGKIYLSEGDKELKEIHSDVPGGTSIPFVSISPRVNSSFFAIVRNTANDEIIVSTDNGGSWKKTEKLTTRVKSLTKGANGVNLLLENNKLLSQNNLDDSSPTFDTVEPNINFGTQTIVKSVVLSGTTYTLTSTGLYKSQSDGTQVKYSLPITDSPVLDFAIDPNNPSHYLVGVGVRLLETSNSGATWTVRNDVGEEEGAGKIQVIHFDPFTAGQVYLGRGV